MYCMSDSIMALPQNSQPSKIQLDLQLIKTLDFSSVVTSHCIHVSASSRVTNINVESTHIIDQAELTPIMQIHKK